MHPEHIRSHELGLRPYGALDDAFLAPGRVRTQRRFAKANCTSSLEGENSRQGTKYDARFPFEVFSSAATQTLVYILYTRVIHSSDLLISDI